MNHNPFANIFKTAFIKDVLHNAVYLPQKQDNLKNAPRVSLFLDSLNKFLHQNGCAPILYQKYLIDERNLLEYALFLRGYMRDAQPILATLSKEHATDPDLIDLFKASSEYVVACNHQFGNKKFFDNNADYRLWQLHPQHSLSFAQYTDAAGLINPHRHHLFLFMPFRIKKNQSEVQKWVFNNMRATLDNHQIFGAKVDIYVQHYPIQKSRSSNICSLLKTLQAPDTYYEQKDMDFVVHNWLEFIKKDPAQKDDTKNLYTKEELCQNFNNITIFAYCSGAANAHRVLNALYSLTAQSYGEAVAKSAMQEIGVITYGFLPIKDNSLYSGIHFYTSPIDDNNRREPFVNLNNHQLYEQTKCTNAQMPARYSVMPDGRNFIIALQMPEQMSIIKDNRPTFFRDGEFGHNMTFINQPNILDDKNYAYHIFCDTLQKFSLGKRRLDDITFSPRTSPDNLITNALLKSRIQTL